MARDTCARLHGPQQGAGQLLHSPQSAPSQCNGRHVQGHVPAAPAWPFTGLLGLLEALLEEAGPAQCHLTCPI